MVIDIALNMLDQALKIFELKEGHREKFFKNHIEPIYTELQNVHKDYKTVFFKIIQSLDDVNANIDQLATSIKKARINFEASRESLKALANVLAIPDHERKALLEKKANSKELTVKELTYEFANAILNYFQPIVVGKHYKSNISGKTFTSFTSLLKLLDDFSASKTPNWEASRRDIYYLQAKAGAKNLAYELDVNFKEISEYYVRLKVACL